MENQIVGFKQKIANLINNLSITKNIITIVLYIISLVIWTANKANPFIKIVAIISILIYITLFFLLIFFSSSDAFSKNISLYKKRIKNINKLLKLLNLFITLISTISLFTFTTESIVAVIINTAILAINILSIIISYFLYRITIKIKNHFKSSEELPKTFIGYYFGTESYIKSKNKQNEM